MGLLDKLRANVNTVDEARQSFQQLKTLLTDLSKCRVQITAAQSINSGIWTQIEFETEVFDTDGDFDTANYEYVTPEDGYYLVTLTAHLSMGTGRTIAVGIRKNDGRHAENHNNYGGAGAGCHVADILNLSAGDTVQGYILHTSATAETIVRGTSGGIDYFTYMTVTRLL